MTSFSIVTLVDSKISKVYTKVKRSVGPTSLLRALRHGAQQTGCQGMIKCRYEPAIKETVGSASKVFSAKVLVKYAEESLYDARIPLRSA